MVACLAWREIRQQIRGRVFWIVFAVSVTMVAGAMAIDVLRVGLVEEGARTGAAAIVRTHLVWTLFFLFTAAAFVGDAVLRDEQTRFANLVRATPVRPYAYALGRFLGGFAAVVLCFASVPAAMAASGAALGLGTGPAGAYLFAFCALALPDLLLISALFFGLAAATRSMTGCLLGAAGLLTLYGLAAGQGGAGPAIVEPFGFAAVADATRGWNVARRDMSWPGLEGELLANRALWLGVAGAFVGLGTLGAAREGRGRRIGASPRARARPRPVRSTGKEPPSVPRQRQSSLRIALAQIAARTRHEIRQVVATPVFLILLIMGLVAAAAAAWRVTGTAATIGVLATSFRLVPVVVALFFAGELFWAEREHGVDRIVGATPATRPVLVLPKLFALAVVLFMLALAVAATGAAVELAKGDAPAIGAYLGWYVLPKAYEWLLLGVLALFLQSLAPNKLAGWGYMVFYLIGSLALNRLGWMDPLYRYGGYPGAPLPPALSGAETVGRYLAGWGVVAAAMTAIACRRGSGEA